jgi:hypothetical protein
LEDRVDNGIELLAVVKNEGVDLGVERIGGVSGGLQSEPKPRF